MRGKIGNRIAVKIAQIRGYRKRIGIKKAATGAAYDASYYTGSLPLVASAAIAHEYFFAWAAGWAAPGF
jgi:hypothetical protein